MANVSDHACRSATPGADVYRPIPCKVTSVRDLTPSEKLYRVEMPGGADLGHQPGQFVQVSILGLEEAPISVATSPTRSGYFELGVRRAGTLTGAMHTLKAGAELGIRGPFGTFFDPEKLRGHDLVLIAGGCGLAPMRSLIQYCEDRRDNFGKVTIVYGAKSPADVLFEGELSAWKTSPSLECHATVDSVPEGHCHDGHVGLVTTLIPPLEIDPARTIAAIVGPPVMYKFVIAELEKKGLPEDRIVVSLERYMRCGIGKCGHCSIDHLLCCIDGPVFWLDQVRKVKGAL